jgi:L-gulono-1,4-lactone dehydrogenase
VYRIEPAGGITDPAKFTGMENGVSITLIQDDDAFNAVTVSMGCMGIVASMTLRVRPRYWLREERVVLSWDNVRAQIEAKEYEQYRNWEVMLNPYPVKGRSNLCLVTRRNEVPEPVNPGNSTRHRNILGELGARLGGNGAALLALMNEFQQIIPGFLNSAIRALEDREYIDRSFAVYDIGAINHVRAFGIEMAVPIEKTVEATERVFEVAAQARSRGWYNTSPFALRFVEASKSHLAMMHGRTTCMIELIFLYRSTGGEKLALMYEEALRDMGARPHWGLDMNLLRSRADVEALYPDSFAAWHAAYTKFNSGGTFNNAFTDRIGISL